MRITFLGAAGEVTGSCFLIETPAVRFLVDCGLFQGGRDAWRRNRDALAFDLRSLDFILLTHAHLDHSGLLPRAAALGFRGPVHATAATADLLSVMLLDAAHIQEKESEWQARRAHGKRGGSRPQPPLYTVAQAQSCLKQLRAQHYGQAFRPHPAVRIVLSDAGHILGSAIAEIEIDDAGGARRLVCSGDLGMPGRPVLHDPQPVDSADLLLIESTYGDRRHRSLAETEEELVEAIEETLRRHGNVIVPAFSVGRTQEVLFVLTDLVRRRRLSHLQVYVDSPMSTAATAITLRHTDLLDAETRELIAWRDRHPEAMSVRFVQDVEESIALNRIRSGAVILSASGMCDAGRIKYHLLHNLGRSECSVIITGFQAAGTLGRRLVDGARAVTLFGETVPVRARVHTIGGLSAHADQEGLLGWLAHFQRQPGRVCIVHGEARASQAFAAAVGQRLGWTKVALPHCGDCIEF